MATSSIRVLVVDDSEPFRRLVCSTLQNKLELRTIVEAGDGVEAIELAQALQPDLVLLDIGLPKLNGIEAARRIRELAPRSKILFVSQESSVDIVQAAFSVGASGYVVKMDAGRELPLAVKAVLRGESLSAADSRAMVSLVLRMHQPTEAPEAQDCRSPQQQDMEVARRHEVGFYSDDLCFLDDLTQFIGAALKAGNAVIVVATELHRGSLLRDCRPMGWILVPPLNRGDTSRWMLPTRSPTFMVNDQPDPVRFLKVVGDLVMTAAKAAKGERCPRCGLRRMCTSPVGAT